MDLYIVALGDTRSDRNLLVTLRFVFLNKRALGHLISETTDISLKWETVPNASASILIYLMTNSQENFLSYLSYFIIKTFGFSRKKIRRSRISTIVYLFLKWFESRIYSFAWFKFFFVQNIIKIASRNSEFEHFTSHARLFWYLSSFPWL